MLTKKNVWFLTLFSIILVMSIYYVSYPTEDLTSTVHKEVTSGDDLSVTVEESETITALRINRDEMLEKELEAIKSVLTDASKTVEEKSDAYEALKMINTTKGKEETIENLLKKNFNYNNFVKIDGSNIKVVIDTNDHSYELANKIINTIQKEFDKKVYITVNFQAK